MLVDREDISYNALPIQQYRLDLDNIDIEWISILNKIYAKLSDSFTCPSKKHNSHLATLDDIIQNL